MTQHAAKAKEAAHKPGWKETVAKAVRRHYKLTIALGGVLVSISLAAKDKMQERVRDISSALDKSLTFVQIGDLGNATTDHMERLMVKEDEIEMLILSARAPKKLATGSSDQELDALWTQQSRDSLATYEKESYSIGNMLKFVESVPELEDLRDKVQQLSKATDELKELATAVHYALSDRQMDYVRDHIKEVSGNTVHVEVQRNDLTQEIFKELNLKKDRAQKEYFYTSFASYGCVFLGFGISLIGHISAKDGELPEIKL